MSTPFVTAEGLAALWRELSGAEYEYAGILLSAASTWIRNRRPGIADDDPAAKIVCVEVVKAVLLPGQWQGFTSWSRAVDDAVLSATLADPAGALTFTDWHYELLGINRNALPVGHFPRDDY
ncbi:hypothetical protein [Gordonia sp. NB41Y]|uniref:hypothetical protein n=1 Tax=Gordonia sp. NB41Y TaxID=875808 RepID=UPI0006BF85D9|nr:hypothetical protein [Gordonia sp. NB41Y]EMP10039.2 hypothetical protein ISGA_1812 [Gordonia sp. NB41Y]WLP90253.1 hypothetical protein Q9K23_22510 [Gordonia sp. NB41Y]